MLLPLQVDLVETSNYLSFVKPIAKFLSYMLLEDICVDDSAIGFVCPFFHIIKKC